MPAPFYKQVHIVKIYRSIAEFQDGLDKMYEDGYTFLSWQSTPVQGTSTLSIVAVFYKAVLREPKKDV